jgi:aryl-alcohol dehydrogenase-like predicted oxidoreductase
MTSQVHGQTVPIPAPISLEKRKLGRTDISASVLGLGTARLGESGCDYNTAEKLLNSALDSGLNFIDTAECYNESEYRIGRAISHRRFDYCISSKIGHSRSWETPDWNEPNILSSTIDTSLRRLRTDHLDVLLLHSCSLEFMADGCLIDVLEKARRNGKTRYIGYSGDGAAALFAVQSRAFDVLEISVNIADQSALDKVLPLAKEYDMGVIAKRPLANIVWTNPTLPAATYYQVYWNRLKTLDYPFLRHGPLQNNVATALHFTLSHYVHTALVGTQRLGRWERNAALLRDRALSSAEIQAIRARWKAVATPSWGGET